MVPDSTPSVSRRRLLGSGIVAFAGLAGCAMPATMTSETTATSFGQNDATALAVETENGDITLEPGDGDRVDVEATKRTSGDSDTLDRIRVVSERTDGTLLIRVDRSDVSSGVTVSVDLDVAVPSSLSVQRVESTNGEVTASGVGGDGTYRTENGDVDVENVDGYLTLRSTNGDVVARDVTGVDDATSTNGDVDLAFRDLRADAAFSSNNGDVTISVPETVDAAVDLATTNGDVTVEGLSLSDRSNGTGSVTGTLGDGTHGLSARTTNGDVTLSALD
ncbi:DUF4097 family beta strand repeat-containing protein [Halorientalis salina]|uniref:DUF4097 family beta strand repeat-containing protein n=1 Tax=Halorientalis salina TaxID=2932266 RepID=UPI0010AC79E7|nr:DUF4097 family beta strand repeat-containing protein [Halorientalis salina]